MSDKVVKGLQKNLQQELDNFRACHKEYQKAVTKRQQLDAQLNENTSVKNELDLLKDDGEVFKLIGPVLIKQDLEEAKQNVAKRIDYIVSELKRWDEQIADIDKKQEKNRDMLTSMQKNLQQASLELAEANCHPNRGAN